MYGLSCFTLHLEQGNPGQSTEEQMADFDSERMS